MATALLDTSIPLSSVLTILWSFCVLNCQDRFTSQITFYSRTTLFYLISSYDINKNIVLLAVCNIAMMRISVSAFLALFSDKSPIIITKYVVLIKYSFIMELPHGRFLLSNRHNNISDVLGRRVKLSYQQHLELKSVVTGMEGGLHKASILFTNTHMHQAEFGCH